MRFPRETMEILEKIAVVDQGNHASKYEELVRLNVKLCQLEGKTASVLLSEITPASQGAERR